MMVDADGIAVVHIAYAARIEGVDAVIVPGAVRTIEPDVRARVGGSGHLREHEFGEGILRTLGDDIVTAIGG
jgi:ribulose 1,5-bisphosphate carboxylase large subunit-like protein